MKYVIQDDTEELTVSSWLTRGIIDLEHIDWDNFITIPNQTSL